MQTEDDSSKSLLTSSSSITGDFTFAAQQQSPTLTRRRAVPHPLRHTFYLSLLLHVFLALLHAVLVVAYVFQWEHSAVFPLARQSLVSVGLVVSLQAFTTIYTVVLVYIVHHLALRRNLHLQQTLTSLHDRASAWTGLGAACRSLVQQLRYRTSVSAVVAIGLYLAGITALHITTPSLVTVSNYNATGYEAVSATSSLPQVNLTNGVVLSQLFLPLIELNPAMSTLGLQANVIYSLLTPNQGYGDVPVNATVFSVQCNLTSTDDPVIQLFKTTLTSNNENAYGTGEAEIYGSFYSFYTGGRNTLQVAVGDDMDLSQDAACVAVLAYTNITDSTGTPANTIYLQVPNITTHGVPSYNLPPQNLTAQMTCCGLSVRRTTVLVDAQARNMTSAVPRGNVNATWEVLAPGAFAADAPELPLQWQELVDNDGDNYIWTQNMSCPELFISPGEPNEKAVDDSVCHVPTNVEGFLMTKLGLSTVLGDGDTPTPKNISLGELEMGLEDLVAAEYWYAGHFGEVMSTDEVTTVRVLNLAGRLNINLIPLIVGASISILLLLLSLILTPQPRDHGYVDTALGSIGILQMFWLAGNYPGISKRLMERVERPTTHNLRMAGALEQQPGSMLGELRERHEMRWSRPASDLSLSSPRTPLRSPETKERYAHVRVSSGVSLE